MSIYTAKSIGTNEPKLKDILEKHNNMSDLEKRILKQEILKNLKIGELKWKNK